MSTVYDVTFDRIGRNYAVEPITVDVPEQRERDAANFIAEVVFHYAKRYLISRHFEVEVDLDECTGSIFTGQPAGSFTVREQRGPVTGTVMSSELGDDWTAGRHLRGES